MPQGFRPNRVGDQIRAELSEVLAREVHDPGIGLVTLTRVTVTPDLQLARVYYRTLGAESGRRQTQRALERATPFLRRQVGGRLRLRRVPEIRFEYDEAVDEQERVEQLLREIRDAAATNEVEPAPDGQQSDHEDDRS